MCTHIHRSNQHLRASFDGGKTSVFNVIQSSVSIRVVLLTCASLCCWPLVGAPKTKIVIISSIIIVVVGERWGAARRRLFIVIVVSSVDLRITARSDSRQKVLGLLFTKHACTTERLDHDPSQSLVKAS